MSENDLELVVQEQSIGVLTTNVKLIRAKVEEMLPQYDAANYTEENIADAKADRAKLNKLKKALNDRRLEFEREFVKPLAEFKEETNVVADMILKAVTAIDKVIKTVEDREKEERRKLIASLWMLQEFDLVPLIRVKKPEWENKATSKKSISADMTQIVADIKSNLGMLEQMCHPEDWNSIRTFYLGDLDFKKAVANVQRVKEAREKAESDRRKALEASIKPAVAAPAAPTWSVPATPETYAATMTVMPPAVPAAPAKIAEAVPEILTRVFRVTAPKWQIIQLGEFMANNGIPFEKVEPK